MLQDGEYKADKESEFVKNAPKKEVILEKHVCESGKWVLEQEEWMGQGKMLRQRESLRTGVHCLLTCEWPTTRNSVLMRETRNVAKWEGDDEGEGQDLWPAET